MSALKTIEAPALSTSYGQNVKQTFDDIQTNFDVLANRELYKGDTGRDLVTVNVPWSTVFTEDSSNPGHYVQNIVVDGWTIENFADSIKTSFESFTSDSDDVTAAIGGLVNGGWAVTVCFEETENVAQVLSSVPFVYVDFRFRQNLSGGSIENLANKTDMSCTILCNGDNNGVGTWSCTQNFPTLYYSDGELYWIINGQKTQIIARGPKGTDGSTGQVYVGLSNFSVSDVNNIIAANPGVTTTLTISYLLAANISPNSDTYDSLSQDSKDHFPFITISDYVSKVETPMTAPIIILPETPITIPTTSDQYGYAPYFIGTTVVETVGGTTSVISYVQKYNICYAHLNDNMIKQYMEGKVLELPASGQTLGDGELTGLAIKRRGNVTTGYSIFVPNGGIMTVSYVTNTTNPSINTSSAANSKIRIAMAVIEGKASSAGDFAHAEGNGAIASGDYSHAEGSSTASGDYSHAEGSSTASTPYSHAEGSGTETGGTASHAEGIDTRAEEDYSHAEGNDTTASGEGSHAEGNTTTASGNYSHAEGKEAVASKTASHAEGNDTTSSGIASHAEGVATQATEQSAHAEGYETRATGEQAHAEGRETVADGEESHAEGYKTKALKDNSHTEGSTTVANGNAAHAEGYLTHALGTRSHAEGDGDADEDVTGVTGSSGSYTSSNHGLRIGDVLEYNGKYAKVVTVPDVDHFTVDNTNFGTFNAATIHEIFSVAYGSASHAEGYATIASGSCSHAEGSATVANGNAAHAEGVGTVTSGDGSHAEGTNTTASGNYSHAEGRATTADGYYSHAEGSGTTAIGEASHAEGEGVTAGTTNWGGSNFKKGFHSYKSSTRTWYRDDGYSDNVIELRMFVQIPSNITTTSQIVITGNNCNIMISPSVPSRSVLNGDNTTSVGDIIKTYTFTSSDIATITVNDIFSENSSHFAQITLRSTANHGPGTVLYSDFSTIASRANNGYTIFVCFPSISLAGVPYIGGTDYISFYGSKGTHAEGCETNISNDVICADGDGAHVEGYTDGTTGSSRASIMAIGKGAHAEGFAEEQNILASGPGAHAEGYVDDDEPDTIAAGAGAHAEGIGCQALYSGAHAEGYNTIANGQASHAGGFHTYTNFTGEYAIGKYNESGYVWAYTSDGSTIAVVLPYDSSTISNVRMGVSTSLTYIGTTIFAVGCGDASNRCNALMCVNFKTTAITPSSDGPGAPFIRFPSEKVNVSWTRGGQTENSQKWTYYLAAKL